MGVTAEQVDDQGTVAMLVTNLTREGATLFRGAKGVFEDVSSQFGLAAPTFGFTGFGTQWLDYDNDGRLDLFIANGAVTIVESQRGSPYPYRQRNLLFHDEGGAKLVEVSDIAGDALQRQEVGRGAAVGDIDNDGGRRCPRDEQQRACPAPAQRGRAQPALARGARGRRQGQPLRHRRACRPRARWRSQPSGAGCTRTRAT